MNLQIYICFLHFVIDAEVIGICDCATMHEWVVANIKQVSYWNLIFEDILVRIWFGSLARVEIFLNIRSIPFSNAIFVRISWNHSVSLYIVFVYTPCHMILNRIIEMKHKTIGFQLCAKRKCPIMLLEHVFILI